MTAGWFLTYHEIPEVVAGVAGRTGRSRPRARQPRPGGLDPAGRGRIALPDVARLAVLLDAILPRCADPGMALANLERFLAAVPGSSSTLRDLAGDTRMAEILLQVFSTSHYFSEVLIRDPELLDWLRAGPERPDRSSLIEELWTTLAGLDGRERAVAGAAAVSPAREPADRLQRHRPRSSAGGDHAGPLGPGRRLRRRGAAAGPGSRRGSLRRSACVRAARRRGSSCWGWASWAARSSTTAPTSIWSSCTTRTGRRPGPRWSPTPSSSRGWEASSSACWPSTPRSGIVYRVDMRLRPDGEQGALASPLAATLGYYVTRGRTWERQALIKCRPVAGDLELGQTFCDEIQPFVYRRFLGAAEIAEIKSLKRRIEQRTLSAGTAEVEVKTGHGGIRDIEFVVQFLQLLHGGEYPEVRHRHHAAGHRPARAGRLPEHRGAHHPGRQLPVPAPGRAPAADPLRPADARDAARRRRRGRTLALRMGYLPASPWEDWDGPAVRFMADYRSKTELNRRILNHLLHDAFSGDDGAAVDPVVDLVLDPEPGR